MSGCGLVSSHSSAVLHGVQGRWSLSKATCLLSIRTPSTGFHHPQSAPAHARQAPWRSLCGGPTAMGPRPPWSLGLADMDPCNEAWIQPGQPGMPFWAATVDLQQASLLGTTQRGMERKESQHLLQEHQHRRGGDNHDARASSAHAVALSLRLGWGARSRQKVRVSILPMTTCCTHARVQPHAGTDQGTWRKRAARVSWGLQLWTSWWRRGTPRALSPGIPSATSAHDRIPAGMTTVTFWAPGRDVTLRCAEQSRAQHSVKGNFTAVGRTERADTGLALFQARLPGILLRCRE